MTPDSMARLHAAAFTHPRPWSAAEFSALLDSKGTFALGDTRAFALIRAIADEAELLTIATHPHFQRQGLARSLMLRCLDAVGQHGADHIFLEVASDNTGALSLYKSTGFCVSGRRPGYYRRPAGPAVDALVLTRKL